MKTDAVFLVALAFVVAGVALIYPPTALIVAGVLLGGLTWAYTKGDE